MQTTTHPTRDEGEPNPINIQRWKPLGFLSFFRPCTCALILTFGFDLFTHNNIPKSMQTNRMHACCATDFRLMLFFLEIWKGNNKLLRRATCVKRYCCNWFRELFVNCRATKVHRWKQCSRGDLNPRYNGPNSLWLPLKIYLRSFVHSQPRSVRVENHESNLRRQSTFLLIAFSIRDSVQHHRWFFI